MYIKSFNIKKFNKIVIEYFDKMSSKAPVTVADINEFKTLEEIERLLKLLPDVGDEMIKMANVPVLRIHIFFDSGEVEYFEFYNGRIKTPDTSFHSCVMKAEVKLYNLLKSQM